MSPGAGQYRDDDAPEGDGDRPPLPPDDDPFEAALADAPKPPPIPEILTKPVDHPAASHRQSSAKASDSPLAGIGGLGKAWGLAMDFVFTIIAAAGLGYVASIWLGHRQAWILGGLGVGFVLAMVRIVRTTMRDEAREQAARRSAQIGSNLQR